jgi:hypothetical protein
VSALGALSPFVGAARPVAPAGERCQVCAEAIDGDAHEHLCDLEARTLLCACRSCATLFAQPVQGAVRMRVVPKRVLVDGAFRLGDAEWAALGLPVRLAFVFFNSRLARWVALYPSPAGATEAELPPGAMEPLAAATPLVAELAPDVEALLIYGRRGGALESFLAPIDACYGLVGRVRLHFRGFHGGDRAWQEIEAFFAGLRARAAAVPPRQEQREDRG